MSTKTPRTTVKDYLQNVGTENEARRLLRRRSGDPEERDPVGGVPQSASKPKRNGLGAVRSPDVRSPRTSKNSGTRANARGEEDEVTPRHLIQNMLTVQGTAQPVTRRRTRRSDGVMGPPPSSTTTRRAARRRSSLSALDLDDVTRKYTPRTNIAGLLQQAPEETPAVRKSSSVTDSLSTTHNVSSFMVNEVGVSLLENRSSGSGLANVSASGGRFRGKKRNLNIALPEVSPASTPQVQRTPESAPRSRTSTPKRNAAPNADKTIPDATPEVMPPCSPLSEAREEEERNSGDTSREEEPEMPGDQSRDAAGEEPALETSGDQSRGSGRNAFSDVGDEEGRGTFSALTEAVVGSDASSSGREQERNQGGPEAQTPSMAKDARGNTPGAYSNSSMMRSGSIRISTSGKKIKSHGQSFFHQENKLGEAGTPHLTSRIDSPHSESQIESSHATSQIESPHATSRFQSSHATSRIQSSHAKSLIQSPHAKSLIQSPHAKSLIESPHAKSLIESPHAKSLIESPHAKSLIQSPHAKSLIQSPHAKSLIQSPHAKSLIQSPHPESQTESSHSESNSTRKTSMAISSVVCHPTPLNQRNRRETSVHLSPNASPSAQAHPSPVTNPSVHESSRNVFADSRRESSRRDGDFADSRRESRGRSLVDAGHESRENDGGFTTMTNQSGGQLLRDQGDGSARRQSKSSAVSKLSNRSGTRELTHSPLRKPSNGPQELHAMEDDYGAGLSPETATIPDVTQVPSDQESSEEEEWYSPLKTPLLPQKPSTPNTVLSKLAPRNQRTEDTLGQPRTTSKRKAVGAPSAAARKRPRQGLPTSVVKAAFSHFCPLRVSREAIEEVEKMSEQYWKSMAEDLEAYATHAKRQTITEADVELLMRRQGFITEKCSMNTLIAKYLPLELRQEMIPIARSGNHVEPKH